MHTMGAPVSRLTTLAATPVLGAALILAACGSSGSGGGDSVDFSANAIEKSQSQLQVQLVSSQVGIGQARLPFGILKPDPKDPNSVMLVNDAVASVKLYQLDGDKGTAAGEYDLTPIALTEDTNHVHQDGSNHTHTDPLATVYVANLNIGKGDWWGADLNIRIGDTNYDDVKVKFFVAAKTTEPGIGDPVPASKQLTTRDMPVEAIDSSDPPQPALHDMTVAEAVASGRPSLVAFATPAFCQTRFCGPVVSSVVDPLAADFKGRVNFLHIEPYDLKAARGQGKLVAIKEMQDWGLVSEPWIFVLDAQGRVAAKFEGIMSYDEVKPVLERVLAESGAAATATAKP